MSPLGKIIALSLASSLAVVSCGKKKENHPAVEGEWHTEYPEEYPEENFGITFRGNTVEYISGDSLVKESITFGKSCFYTVKDGTADTTKILKLSGDTLIIQSGFMDEVVLIRGKLPPKKPAKPQPVPFAGVYITNGYLTNLLGSRDPVWAQEQGELKGGNSNLDILVIPDSTGKPIYNGSRQDSIIVVKEKGEWFLKNRRDNSVFWTLTIEDSGKISYTDLNPSITFTGLGRIQGGNYSYDRIDTYRREYSNGKFPNYHNAFIFAGTYTDSAGAEVVFGANGTVKGLSLGTEYSAWQDYTLPGSTANLVSFGTTPDLKKMDLYCFDFAGDTLTVSTIKLVPSDGDPMYEPSMKGPDGVPSARVPDAPIVRLIRK